MESLIIFISLFILVILAFIGFCIYGLIKKSSAAKNGRQVDARVLSCETKLITDRDGNQFSYYLVTVDFYGLNGDTIVKTVKSKKSYEEGDIIRSTYLDKNEQLWLDSDSIAKNGKSSKLIMLIGFLAALLVFVIIVIYMNSSEEDQTNKLKIIFGYAISIVFIGIGIMGFKKTTGSKKAPNNMQIVDGTQVDYYTVRGRTFDEPNTYYPIYEFELMGKVYRHQSNVGSSRNKHRSIGRKVHMLINTETGKIMCKEDEQTKNSTYLLFGVIGVLVLCIMLAISFGIL